MALSKSEFETRLRLLLDEARQEGLDLADTLLTPAFVEEHVEDVTRTGQVLAFFFVPVVVMVNLELIVVLNQLITELLGARPLGAGQDPIFAWLVTTLTAGAYVLSAWAWFQFVRTGGFGLFTWNDL